jgi:hypothetical protein
VRIKNVLNYRKPSFWIVIASITEVTVVGIALAANPKQTVAIRPEDIASENPSVTPEVTYTTEYKKVKIEFLSDMKFKCILFCI